MIRNMETKKNLLKKIDDASTDEIILSKISLEEDFEGTLQDEIEIARAEAAKIGREEGREEGRKEGREEGIEKNTIDTIKAMLNNNLDIDLISKITNKSKFEILEIREKIDT